MPWISAFSSKIVCHQWHPTASRKGQETLLLHRWFRCPGASENQWWTNGESMANQWWLVHNGEYLWNIYGISMEYLWYIYWILWFSCGKHNESIASKGLFSIHRMMIPPKRPGNDQTTLQRISGWPAFAAHLGAVASQLLPWPTVGKSPHMNGQMIPTVSGFLHWFLHWSFSLHGNISHPPFKVFPS